MFDKDNTVAKADLINTIRSGGVNIKKPTILTVNMQKIEVGKILLIRRV